MSLAVVGLACLTFVNATKPLMQLSTDPAMRGRVMALRALNGPWPSSRKSTIA